MLKFVSFQNLFIETHSLSFEQISMLPIKSTKIQISNSDIDLVKSFREELVPNEEENSKIEDDEENAVITPETRRNQVRDRIGYKTPTK